MLEGIAAARGLELRIFDSDPLDGPVPDDLAGLREGDVVVLSHVAYRSGALADMAALTAAARSRGATLIWDLSHSAGAVPVDLRGAGAELAVGCTYKYLNAGPGAPGYLYVASELQEQLRSPVQGWFGQREQFAMERDYDPVPGIGRFLAGTPPILQLAAVEEGAKLTAEAGMEAIRAKSVALTELIVALHDAWLEPLGFSLGSPREAARRGSHVSLNHPRAWTFTRALIDAGVTPDFRGPDSIRLGVAPLYTSFGEVWDALDRLRAIARREDLPDAPPARVASASQVGPGRRTCRNDLWRARAARAARPAEAVTGRRGRTPSRRRSGSGSRWPRRSRRTPTRGRTRRPCPRDPAPDPRP